MKKNYHVYSEGYSITNYETNETKHFAQITFLVKEGDEIVDNESDYITDKWGGQEITNIPICLDGWDYPEFSNGTINMYEGPYEQEALDVYKDLIDGSIEFESLEA